MYNIQRQLILILFSYMHVCIFTNLYTQYKIKIILYRQFCVLSRSALFCGFFQDPFLFPGTQFLVVCIELLWRFHSLINILLLDRLFFKVIYKRI